MKVKLFLYLLTIAASLAIIGGSVYYLLGGMKKVVVYDLPGEQKIVAGKPFQGRITERAIQDHFYKARRLVLDSAIRGTLTQIVYQSDTLKDHEVAYFTGVAIEGTMAEIPPDYTVRKIRCERKFAIFLSMHPLVRPSPEEVWEMLSLKADSLGYILQPYTVELHFPDNSMSIEGFGMKP